MANGDQCVATPSAFVSAVEATLGVSFKYDMAANTENFKCERYFTEADNSLVIDWPRDGWCWLNPPFRNLTQWIKKCDKEMTAGSRIVTIWPLSGDQNQVPVWVQCEVNVIHGRVWPEVRGVMVCVWDWARRPLIRGLTWDKKEHTLTYSWGKPLPELEAIEA